MKKPLIIHPDDNPQMTSLVERSNEIVKQWGKLNKRVIETRVPRLWIFRFKEQLIGIGREIKAHEKGWGEWYKEARKFSLNPQLKIPAGGPSDITFLHFTAEFRERIRSLDDQMRLLDSNYSQVWGNYQDQRNLLISWGALALSIASSIISLTL